MFWNWKASKESRELVYLVLWSHLEPIMLHLCQELMCKYIYRVALWWRKQENWNGKLFCGAERVSFGEAISNAFLQPPASCHLEMPSYLLAPTSWVVSHGLGRKRWLEKDKQWRRRATLQEESLDCVWFNSHNEYMSDLWFEVRVVAQSSLYLCEIVV